MNSKARSIALKRHNVEEKEVKDMITTHVEEVIKLAKQYNLIPVVRPLLADMETPIRIFRRVAQREQAFCWKV